MAWVSPRAWVAETLTFAKMNEISSSLNVIGDKPPAYTPTVPAGFSSNFTPSGTNRELGKWTEFTITLVFTGAPAGAGVVAITLPSTPSSDYGSGAPFGTCTVRDVSTGGVTAGVATFAGGSNLTAYFGATRLQVTNPYTLASGDLIQIMGKYYRD